MNINFSKSVYFLLIAVLVAGFSFLVTRSQYVLTFQQNGELLHIRDEIKSQVVQEKEEGINERRYCVAFSSSNESSKLLMNNAVKTLELMKRSPVPVDLDSTSLSLPACDVLLSAVDRVEALGSGEALEEFVHDGGYLLFLTSLQPDPEFVVLHRKMGISSFEYQVSTYGIRLDSTILIGEKGLEIEDEFLYNSSLLVSLDGHAELMATSAEEIPLIWKTIYGKGAFVVCNGSFLEEKLNRGMLAGAISLMEPDFIYPIFNAKVFFIDDFPAPVAKGRHPVIYEQYKKELPVFYREIWWPNMLGVAKRNDIRYTGVLIETYGDDVTPPYPNPIDAVRMNLISYGREILKSGGELGIHGYNHQPLTMDQAVADHFDYTAWKNTGDMVSSIEEALDYAEGSFPSYTLTSYVPPSNVLSTEGRAALLEAWPDLTVISSLYLEDKTGISYVQEYEITADGVIEMPRVTSGYMERQFDRWAEANAMTAVGVFSNFVHPDDAISEDRSFNMTWEEIYRSFENNMARVKRTYPWVRPLTATEAALDMAHVLNTQVQIEQTDNSIEGTLSTGGKETFFILRTERKIGRLTNCKVNRIDEGVFLVTVDDSRFKLELGGY